MVLDKLNQHGRMNRIIKKKAKDTFKTFLPMAWNNIYSFFYDKHCIDRLPKLTLACGAK